MPIRIEDPFRDPTTNLKPDVNAFLDKMVNAQNEGSLALAYGPKLKEKVGKWKSSMSVQMNAEPKSLVVEIGSHMGDVMCEMANNHPDTAFIGLDITFKRVVTLAEKAAKKELNNIFSVLGNGGGFEHMFSESEADGLIIFFPDPWVRKKKQRKKRLINPTFLEQAVKVLRKDGFFWFKTDHKPYFDEVCDFIKEFPFKEMDPVEGIPSETYTSKFEQHFNDLGEPSYSKVWVLK